MFGAGEANDLAHHFAEIRAVLVVVLCDFNVVGFVVFLDISSNGVEIPVDLVRKLLTVNTLHLSERRG